MRLEAIGYTSFAQRLEVGAGMSTAHRIAKRAGIPSGNKERNRTLTGMITSLDVSFTALLRGAAPKLRKKRGCCIQWQPRLQALSP